MRWLKHTIDELAFNVQVVRWLAKHGQAYDVVHFHGRSGLGWPILFPARLSHCLLTLHGLTREEGRFGRKSLDNWLHTRIFGWAEKVAISRLATVVAVSEDEANRICRDSDCLKRPIRTIPNGIVTHEEKAMPPDRWITFSGRMEKVKGVDLLPGILQGLPADVGLYMVGTGSERSVLERQFREMGLTDRVVWTGAIFPEAVLTYLEKSRLLVLPSRYEPQGRVVLEAMSIGRPVVASNVGGIPEMLTHGSEGLLADPQRPDTFVTAISQLLAHPEQAVAMGKRGREKAQRDYSWRRLGQEIELVYRNLATLPQPSRP
jgi:glycosyltransferase involved in cell wall biosynthesis